MTSRVDDLAKRFQVRIRKALSMESRRIIDFGNRSDPDAIRGATCYTHEFCDANVYMLEALESLGLEYDPGSRGQTDLINDAWNKAKYDGFGDGVMPEDWDRCIDCGIVVCYYDDGEAMPIGRHEECFLSQCDGKYV